MTLNILVIDEGDFALDWVLRCLKVGHKIKWFLRPDKDGTSLVGDGFPGIEKVKDFEKVIQSGWPDLIMQTDNVRYCQILDRYRANIPIIGPSFEAQQLEHDRVHGMKVLNKAGIKTPKFHAFSNYDEAEKFIRAECKKNPARRFVSKPSGDADKALSYCSKNAADMITMFNRWRKTKPKDALPFLLQEFVAGVEMAVGGWFGPNGFNKHFFENFEFKKLMADDLGPSTGEMGTIGKYVTKSKLADTVLKPLVKQLKAMGYVGYIDVNCIISEGEVHPLEFTARFGWPCFQLQSSMHKGDPASWLESLWDGQDTLSVSTDVVCGVVITIPDYPYSKLTSKMTAGFPIWGVDMRNNNFHPSQVMLSTAHCMLEGKLVDDMPCMVTAGDYVATITGQGKTVKGAMQSAYSLVEKIHMPNSMMYRNDIGRRLREELPELHEYGFAKEFSYNG